MKKDTFVMQSASLVQGPALLRNKTLQPLCHEHHLKMRLSQVPLQTGSKLAQTLVYACPEPDCLIHYNSSRGYFPVV